MISAMKDQVDGMDVRVHLDSELFLEPDFMGAHMHHDHVQTEIVSLQKHVAALRDLYRGLEAETDPLRSRLQKLVQLRSFSAFG